MWLLLYYIQVALLSVKDNIGTLSYVEFVLYPEAIFNSFVGVADRLLEPIRPAGGAQDSEPPQQVRITQLLVSLTGVLLLKQLQ